MPAEPKYLIRKKLLQKDGSYRENLYTLAIKAKRTVQTIENWQRIKKDSKSDIAINDLYIMCEFFNCNPNELING
jgi:DNA-binding Xre family transcriptional regulator